MIWTVGICSCKSNGVAHVGALWQSVLTAITCIYNALPINRASILKYFWTCVDSDLISVYTRKKYLGSFRYVDPEGGVRLCFLIQGLKLLLKVKSNYN